MESSVDAAGTTDAVVVGKDKNNDAGMSFYFSISCEFQPSFS